MNEMNKGTTLTETPITKSWPRADDPDTSSREAGSTVSRPPGSFAEGEETLPERDVKERALNPGSFAAGVEKMPEANADRRIHGRGGFAVGEEATPEADAEARRRPGSFADTEAPSSDPESAYPDPEA